MHSRGHACLYLADIRSHDGLSTCIASAGCKKAALGIELGVGGHIAPIVVASRIA